MASRRAQPNRQLPQPTTQVVSSPVNTAVRQGKGGAPVAPIAPAKPLGADMQEAQEAQALANAFGGLSQSLQRFGTAVARKEARTKAQERRDAYDTEQEAKEAAELVDLQESMKQQRIVYYNGVNTKQWAHFGAPGFRTDLSKLLGARAARESYNATEWNTWFDTDGAMELGSAGKRYDSQTLELVKAGMGYAGNSGAYQAGFLAQRSKDRYKIVQTHEAKLAAFVKDESKKEAKGRLLDIVQSEEPAHPAAHPKIPPVAAAHGMPGSPNEIGGRSRADQVTDVLDGLRGTILQGEANEFVGSTLVDFMKSASSEDELADIIEVFETTMTGPEDSRTRLADIPAVKTLYRQQQKSIAKIGFTLHKKKLEEDFDAFEEAIEQRIVSSSRGDVVDRHPANVVRDVRDYYDNLPEGERPLYTFSSDDDNLYITPAKSTGLERRTIPLKRLVERGKQERFEEERASIIAEDVNADSRVNPKVLASTATSIRLNVVASDVRSSLGAGVQIESDLDDKGIEVQTFRFRTGFAAYELLKNDPALLKSYGLHEMETHIYEMALLVKNNPALQGAFANDSSDWVHGMVLRISSEIGKGDLHEAAEEDKDLRDLVDRQIGTSGALGIDRDKVYRGALLLKRITNSGTNPLFIKAVIEGFKSNLTAIGPEGSRTLVAKGSVATDILNGTHPDMEISGDHYVNNDQLARYRVARAVENGTPPELLNPGDKAVYDSIPGLVPSRKRAPRRSGSQMGAAEAVAPWKPLPAGDKEARIQQYLSVQKPVSLNEQLTYLAEHIKDAGSTSKGLSETTKALSKSIAVNRNRFGSNDFKVVVTPVPGTNKFRLGFEGVAQGNLISRLYDVGEMSLRDISDFAGARIESTETDRWIPPSKPFDPDPQKWRREKIVDYDTKQPLARRPQRDVLLDDTAWENAPRDVRVARYSFLRNAARNNQTAALVRTSSGRPDPKKTTDAYYDMDAAVAAGMTADETGHWPSRVDQGPEEGLILKDVGHPTFMKTVAGEKKAGMVWYQNTKTGKYHTFKKTPSNRVDIYVKSGEFVKKEPTKREIYAASEKRKHPVSAALKSVQDRLIKEIAFDLYHVKIVTNWEDMPVDKRGVRLDIPDSHRRFAEEARRELEKQASDHLMKARDYSPRAEGDTKRDWLWATNDTVQNWLRGR